MALRSELRFVFSLSKLMKYQTQMLPANACEINTTNEYHELGKELR